MTEFRCEQCDKEFVSKEALNMHNQSKHQESCKEPLFSKRQKKRIRNYGVIIIIVLAITGFFYWRSIPPKNSAIIEIEPSSYDFGMVSQAEGVISATIGITNKGNEPLIINKIDTSCGCTSAAVIYKGVEGPRFSMAMHGTNPKDWRQVIQPGEAAELKVYYDPNVHKELRGSVRRSVFIYSNDPRDNVKEIAISANQAD